jgi:hypothetical protein
MVSNQNATIILISGMIMVAFGLLFTAQSKSEIGPQSSFMYDNPKWTVNGLAIAAFGFVVAVTGLILLLYRRFSHKVVP